MTTELYDSVGGLEGCRRLSAAFYARVVDDPLLKPMFPSIHCAVEALATFLAQFLGGPCLYSQQRWYLSLREAHLRFKIGPKERAAWLRNMRKTLADSDYSDAARAALNEFFDQSATYLMNGEGEPIDGALAPHWKRHLDLEEAIASVRAGSVPELEHLADCFERDPMSRVALLGMMIAAGMDEPVSRQLAGHPELARARYVRGRTLLHDAATAGRLELMTLLLQLGADPNGGEGHSPLYDLANAGPTPNGAAAVRLLVAAGADVNAAEGSKRCTALHMAARRGNVPVAEALLDSGARLDARDSHGDTPFRRAMNCRKKDVAAMLQARGAQV
jgi:truncated hemoglobin YjbI